jgi:hypothetical protein
MSAARFNDSFRNLYSKQRCEPHLFAADPDPACHFDATPEPNFQFDTDPYPDADPGFQVKAQNLEEVLK